MSSIKEFEYLRISLDTIKLATNDFSTSNYISQGGFGKVYKGDIVQSGQRVVSTAIKRLDRSFGQGTTEFWKEVRFLATYKHENLVSLLGYCDEDGENILVYEYAPNGSLSKLISGTSLSWEQRLNICIGSARGLEFLHNPQGTMQRVLHCDIKSSNILLDKHFNALLSDFGLSKFGPANQEYTFVVADATGTLGYIDPLYYKLGYLTKESDIYSFGVVLFEVLCGRLCIETKYDIKDERRLLPTLAQIRYEEKRLDTIIHDSLRDKINPQSWEIFSAIAYKCLKSAHTDRPTAAEIVSELELALKKELGDAAVPRDIKKKIYGRVVMRMSTDTTRFSHVQSASLNFLGVHDICHKKITFQLIISADHPDDGSSDGRRGKYGKHAFLEEYNNSYPFDGREAKVEFEWNVDIGFPAAVLVSNPHNSEFYLESFTLENVPGHGQIHFVCSSWVYPSKCYSKDRIFFVNKAYLPHETPEALRSYREEELAILRGDGSEKLEEWDRVYNYDIYNDLGNPDKGQHYARPVLGGSTDYPYPRRGRTGRPFTRSDPKSESRVPHALSIDIYVPRDEKFGQRKLRNVVSHGLIAITQLPLNEHDGEFYKLHEVSEIYKEGLELPNVNSHGPPGGPFRVKFPIPDMIKGKSYDWHSDEEFARQMLAGVNPVSIRLLKNFPPTSKLDFRVFGYQNSSIRSFHIEESLDGLTIGEAVESNKLFILDHHDSLMPYLRKINETSTKVYATRTLLLLKKDGTLKPLAIELSLPHPDGDQLGAVGAVYTPAKYGLKSTIWQMAKAYAAVNDSGIHQLISHWLNTHAVIEPFVIATHRQLSVLHPMHKLLHPHFHHTMSINAFWRQMLINEGGFLEKTLFTGRYGMEMSSMIYKDWALRDQALPVDLVKRGMAIEDSNSPHGLHLVIEDYPYAVDGLEIWFAIKTWVEDYCSIYYKSDHMVENDTELQSWWTEIRTEGHGDKKHDPWWPKMHTCHDLVDTCTTIIWVASALHAAVNFGQYTYAGYLSNHPSISCRFLPQPGSPDHDKQLMDPEGTMSKTFPFNREMLLGMSLAKLLSTHTSDEVYLGQREFHDWTADSAPLNAFKKFNKKLKEIERRIVYRNNDANLKNRIVPYNLLYPSSEVGLTGKGIPNSVSM